MAELIQAGSFVTASERNAALVLKQLPAEWKVICNKELVAPSGVTYEVDFIVVCDHAVFVIDEKSWSGDILGNENVWLLPGGEPRRKPLATIAVSSIRQCCSQLTTFESACYLASMPNTTERA